MKKIKTLLPALAIILVTLVGCSNSAAQNPNWERVSNEEFKKLLDEQEFQLVDVRTPSEYNAGKIGDAILMNVLDGSFATKIEQLDKETPVMIYCRSGNRSQKAAQQLLQAGFTKVYELKSGITGWSSGGYEIEN
jgi:rhodanese-related sulfurtransferase